MHELGIVRSLIEEIINQARENKLKKIDKVCLSIKEDGHLTADSLKFNFQILAKETILEKTILEITKISTPGVIINQIEGEGEDGTE